ncbi:calcium/calmodulin-stimulated cyclic nucleotide phosphodiesterase, putative [Perkinsus marinus ATCC 50983]|uniref:Phosphodiesterase n=1 Tax=Perkinsus marinus (strain ATCC 50983 / TXsc) TaxID=423536 RepID=C5KP18_PERM5|nr:calcium/calmodulin-stimulated cyclic nucleotide phosphodiesterase, putative [Perkinsus marinus ATCC 50983]EER13806.1 calcium/calmodulin-stimulated cyclic nucleotide phosphodiesterase, putative [Perkinsus marinus ATCC 50983]|eukprot:XP_002782011.1 calcium/calmodulin-stimulated cyclic nucleotide phosphodiesterase, putative [Perkinsus marinus ATCC 50983]
MDFIGAFSLFLDISWALGDNDQSLEFNSGFGSNVVLLRAARTTKLGARAGRITRVMRLLKWLPGVSSTQDESAGTAKVLGSRLINALSTRVSMLTIGLVMVLPIFDVMKYPNEDHSMQAWAQQFASQVHVFGEDYIGGESFNQTIVEFLDFYDFQEYRPVTLVIEALPTGVLYAENFAEPPNRISNELWVTSHGYDGTKVQVMFDFTAVSKTDAGANIALVITVIIVMILSATLLSNSVSQIVLVPLEGLFCRVRDMAKTIFKTVSQISKVAVEERQEDEHLVNLAHSDEDLEDSGAFMSEASVRKRQVLEAVVEKLAVLSEMFIAKHPVDAEELKNLGSDDLAVLDMITQNQARKASQDNEILADRLGRRATALRTFVSDLQKSGLLDCGLADSWNYDVLQHSLEQNDALLKYIFLGSGISHFITGFIDLGVLEVFLRRARLAYLDNPYHNWYHAVDVTHTVYRYLVLSKGMAFFQPLDCLAVLLAAVVHDIGHPGVNNPYLIETAHELALRYNDKSPLENMHCARFFELSSDAEANVLQGLSKQQYRDARRIMIECILHTDNAHHFEMIKTLQMLYQLNREIVDEGYDPEEEEWSGECIALYSSNDVRMTLLQLFLHAADISNPTKPFESCKAWANRVLDEFFAQGDLEKAQNIPVQMLNDRNTVSRPHSQIGFLEFLVAPLFLLQVARDAGSIPGSDN